MTESNTICPYTGLRSFTEEESLYFKGRDEQIDQVASLLEHNKFLMLTGASGEGKSSLIYAGLIPNARAGFFKAKYTNWVVTDFRPERSPVKNMASAVAQTFGANPATIETELRRGFSSLVDLYVNSSFYTDEQDDHWKELNDTEKKNKTRSAANLLIIVDQFEEFFTNPENYLNETPSQDSQVVVNLALETARIALQRNLPVYVVCTMRSDYIGQCSAFRGLPEYIGFSQFFVPRLKRKEIKQVIEEPAVLSGNRITRRLVERLVYDLADGIDQLPILQHALRQVWLAANNGTEEMDLIHYAMVGGMPAHELPDDDQNRYKEWFVQVPEAQKKFYADPGLNKIIEIHASRLYEGAWANFHQAHKDQPITQKDAKRIVALTFSCLTKIDDSRAVRNRMSLAEITNIINQPNLTTEVVGSVLNLFRESNNSFIRPYKTDEEHTHNLAPESVLDITHEALIRNWGLLNKWANQEFEFYSTFLDFKKQLLRWKDSNKNSGFLLPLGPLTYFENWYNQCKPNLYWIDRYSEIKNNPQQSLQQSETLLADTREFIKRSASKVTLTRAFMKYGAGKIAVGVALIAMVLMTGFYWYDAQRKTNSRVQSLVMEKAHQLLQSKEVNDISKATYLLIEERLNNGSLLTYLSGLTNAKQRLELSIAAYRVLLYFDKHSALPLKTELMDRIVSELKSYPGAGQERATFLIEQQNQFLLLLAYDEYYNPSARVADEVIPAITGLQHLLITHFATTSEPYKQMVPTELNLALQLWLTFGKPATEDIIGVLEKMSPLDSAAKRVFDHYYVKGNYEANGRIPSDYNGGYHTMASLYAAVGDVDAIIRCFEQLPEAYFRSSLFNNYNNVLGYLYQYKHVQQTSAISKWLVEHFPSDDPLTVYRNTVIRSGYIPGMFGINLVKNYARSNTGYFHVNLGMGKREQFFAIAEEYEKLAKEVKDPNERNYLLAMHYKRVAILYSKYLYDRGLPLDQNQMDGWLDKAWVHFKQVNEEHLAGKVAVNYRYLSDGIRTIQSPRKLVFLYPDYRDGFFAERYNTDVFVEHAVRNGLLKNFYNTPETIEMLHEWISTSTEMFFYKRNGEATGYFKNDFVISDTLLAEIITFVDSSLASKSFDKNLPILLLANRSFEKGDTTTALDYFQKLEKEKLLSSGNKYEYVSQIYFINAMIDLATHLAVAGHINESLHLIARYEPYQKAFFYTAAANSLYDQYKPAAFAFLDSAFVTIKQIDYNQFNGLLYDELDAKRFTIYVLGKVGGDRVNKLSYNYIKELIERSRVRGIRGMILGTATDGNYYTALTTMPPTLTEDEELQCYFSILGQIARSQNKTSSWAGMDESLLWEFNYFMGI
jgi:energy-coupling factor transporter ATP-binding protein EcfA2